MRPRFKDPRLNAVKARELPLSGQALLDLMRDVLARGVPFRFRARGWSMAPFIKDGDVITVSPFQGRRPGLGEVVAFVRPGENKLVVHRIVRQDETNLYIQGDNSPDHVDEVIPGENLLGRVRRIERNGRRIWLGLGPERSVIAWLSHGKRLVPLQARLVSFLRRFT